MIPEPIVYMKRMKNMKIVNKYLNPWTDEKRLKISLLSRLLDLSAEYEDILKQAQKLKDKDVVTCAMGMTLKDVVELNAKEAYELAVKNFEQADQNHDGRLSPTEFEHWYTSSEVVRLCDVLKRCFRKSNAKVKEKLEQEMRGIDRWEPPMKIERSRKDECPLVNAVVKNRYSIDYHRGTGGYKVVYVVFERGVRAWCSSVKRENLTHFHILTFSCFNYVKRISLASLTHATKKSLEHATLKCTLKCYVKLNSRFALEHRYARESASGVSTVFDSVSTVCGRM